jgi:hypothetical protein
MSAGKAATRAAARAATVALRRKVRGQRISHEDLVAEAQQVLLESGIRNYTRADFVNRLAKVVVGNDAPILCQLQPRARENCSPSWLYAWDLVSSFVAQNNLALTIDTLNVELTTTKQKLRLTLKETRNADGEFNDLLYSSTSGLSDSESVIRRGRLEKQGALESGSEAELIDDPKLMSPPRASPARAGHPPEVDLLDESDPASPQLSTEPSPKHGPSPKGRPAPK